MPRLLLLIDTELEPEEEAQAGTEFFSARLTDLGAAAVRVVQSGPRVGFLVESEREFDDLEVLFMFWTEDLEEAGLGERLAAFDLTHGVYQSYTEGDFDTGMRSTGDPTEGHYRAYFDRIAAHFGVVD